MYPVVVLLGCTKIAVALASLHTLCHLQGRGQAERNFRMMCCAGSDSGSSQGLRSAPVSFIRSKSQRPLRQVEAEAAQRDAAAAVLARKPAASCEVDTSAHIKGFRVNRDFNVS